MDIKSNKKYDLLHNNDVYMEFFLNNLSLRESYTDCKFKGKIRSSNITLADFFGIKNINQKMNDEKGTSLVIVNSEKGMKLFNEVKNFMKYEEVDFELAIKYNQSF